MTIPHFINYQFLGSTRLGVRRFLGTLELSKGVS